MKKKAAKKGIVSGGLLGVVRGDGLPLFQIKKKIHFPHPFSDLAPAVKWVDSYPRINVFPVDRAIIGFPNTHASTG